MNSARAAAGKAGQQSSMHSLHIGSAEADIVRPTIIAFAPTRNALRCAMPECLLEGSVASANDSRVAAAATLEQPGAKGELVELGDFGGRECPRVQPAVVEYLRHRAEAKRKAAPQ
jgi:hypothetical protein